MTEAVSNQEANSADARAETRKSLMLRSAKVVCQSGEYVCLIRDVAPLGTSLSFLHDVPPEPRIILALGNGLTFPIEKVWSGKRQAGYRFADRVSISEFMHENSPFQLRPVRIEVSASARITDGRHSFSAEILDLSTHGAKFASEGNLKPDRLVGFQISGMKQRLGQVVWCDETDGSKRFGFQFQHPLSLQELADTALRMQPFSWPMPSSFSDTLGNASAA